MPNTVTSVTSESWGGRLMGSIKSVLFGIVLFIASFVVLWWNEGNSVAVATGLTEGAGIVIKANSDRVLPENDGKLVHVSGDLKTEEYLDDADFGIHVNALKLSRRVATYQWVESSKSEETKKIGGGTETTTTYTYDLKWADELINSSDFHEPQGHENPTTRPVESNFLQVSNASIGAFVMSQDLMNEVDHYSDYPVNSLEGVKLKGAVLAGTGIYVGKGTNDSPQIGDCRIVFSVVKPGPVSVVAKQSGTSFEGYTTHTGTTISLLDEGIVSPEKMFEEAQEANALMTWLIRLGGFLCMFFGLSMAFRPFTVLADVLPFLGNLLGAGVGIFSFAVSLLLSLVTIGLAWVFYRPVLGVSLLAIGIGVFILLYRRSKAKRLARQANQVQPVSTP